MIEGRVWVFGDDINTDLIQPMHAALKAPAEQIKHVFEANRPGWAQQVSPGDIIVAGENMGTGSSRPASRVLKDLGIGGVIANSLNTLFLRNCVNYALPAIECEGVREVFSDGDRAAFDIRTGEVQNLTTGHEARGRPWPEELLEILEAGGLIQQLRSESLLVE
jgi:3-isopropylmalate/(R)-2-methylmalate dehydratase small subunit